MPPTQTRRGQGGRMAPAASPALFNRLARLQRQQIGAIAYSADTSNNFLELPNVGYHYRVFTTFDLDLGTTGGAPTARFLSGHFGGNTNRFPCPTGLVKGLRYTLNVSSPIYATDGYGNYLLQLVANRGLNPWAQVATGDVGRNRKERALFCILNNTTGALVLPDSALAATTNYKIRGMFLMPLTLGESATAGLIPVQDIRISPQVFMDFGNRGDIVSVAGDISVPTGNFNVFVDYFTTPNDAVRPDTDFVMQTRMDVQSVGGTGEQKYRPQIGGIILRTLLSVWNSSKAVDVSTIDSLRLRVQQGIELEKLTPQIHIADERRWYSKLLPDEAYLFDHISGFGDPTMPSLRDRIASNQLTRLEYILDWNSGVAPAATAEIRSYLQQLIPLPRV